METKIYCAPSMALALAEVKKDLGRDAVILHTRQFRKGGLFGLGGRAMWEVTASAHVNVPQRVPAGRYVPVPSTPAGDAAVALDATSTVEPLGDVLSQRMGEIHNMVARLLRASSGLAAGRLSLPLPVAMPEELASWRAHLLRQELAEETVSELLSQLQQDLTPAEMSQDSAVRERLVDLIASRIPASDVSIPAATGRPRVVVLVGPTGVGKTTTIAKLAARHKLSAGRRVGLVTIDTYRIAAVDQLKTYAQIIEVPLRTVLRPAELAEAITSMAGLDVVLIDTAGRSPTDAPRLRQMQEFLQAAQPDEVHLVVSVTVGPSCAARVIENFMPLGANRLIVSKLDEASTFGMVLNVASAAKAALSFVTTGQEVPDDIAPANPRRLAELIVGEGTYGG